MDSQDNKNQQGQDKKKVSTKVTCPHCGKEFETWVEVPEPGQTPKMTWQT